MSEELESGLLRALRPGDANHGVRQLAKMAAGKTVGVSEDDILAALPELDGVGVTFDIRDSLSKATLYYDEGGYQLADWPDHIPATFGVEDLDRHEAGAMIDGACVFDVTEVD